MEASIYLYVSKINSLDRVWSSGIELLIKVINTRTIAFPGILPLWFFCGTLW